jgi:hypothetical protein
VTGKVNLIFPNGRQWCQIHNFPVKGTCLWLPFMPGV